MNTISVSLKPTITVRWPWLVGAGLTMATCWTLLWTVHTFWNPLFFVGLWTSATILARTLQGEHPMPMPRQPLLMVLSAPMWWWFEIVNGAVDNWKYHGAETYSPHLYFIFATLAFSTVVPALDAAWRACFRAAKLAQIPNVRVSSAWGVGEIVAGLASQTLVFVLPTYFYAFVWLAPFLVMDGVVGLLGGPNIAREIHHRHWQLPLAVGAAGILCGFFWEFWNFWAMPKWTYDIPYVHFLQIFEMPLLGYFGYVPFAWFTFQFVQLAERAYRAVLTRPR